MKNGIYYDMPEEEYRALPCPSYSSLKAVLYNAHLWKFGEGFVPTDASRWGLLVDCLALTPEQFHDRYVVGGAWPAETVALAAAMIEGDSWREHYVTSPFDTFRTKEAREWRDAELAKNPAVQFLKGDAEELAEICAGEIRSGRERITEERRDLAEQAVSAMLAEPTARAALDAGKSQVAMVWEVDGRQVKGLIDWVPAEGADFLVDIKTTADASPTGYRRQVFKLNYHIQAGLYLDGWNKLHPDDPRSGFHHIVSERKSQEVATYSLLPQDIAQGLALAREALEKLTRCEETGCWPGYTSGWEPLEGWKP